MEDGLGAVQRALVVGARAELAAETLRRLVTARTRAVALVTQDPGRVEPLAAELRRAGADTAAVAFDPSAPDTYARAAEAGTAAGDLDLVLVTVTGPNGDSPRLEPVNVAPDAVTSGLAPLADVLTRQGHGVIVAVAAAGLDSHRIGDVGSGGWGERLDAAVRELGESRAPTGVRTLVVRIGPEHPTVGRAAGRVAATNDAVAAAIVRGIASHRPRIWVPPSLQWAAALRSRPILATARRARADPETASSWRGSPPVT